METTDNSTSSTISGGAQKRSHYKMTFHGSNTQFLGLSLYNILLTVLTLGIYYPWAKCAIRKFLWQETEIAGSRFEWHGTGKEMFRGFIKAYLILGSLLLIINFGPLFIPPEILVWVILASYLVIIALIPLVIHGMVRYRLSRTTLKGIRFGYRGDVREFFGKTALDFFFTILTFGIYGAWLQVNIRKYVMEHSRFGNVSARFHGTGGDLFGLSILQGILTVITFYIYLPWAIIEFHRFYVRKTSLVQNDKNHFFNTTATGGKYLLVLIKALLITVFTLGIAAPIGQLMIHKFFVENLMLHRNFDFDSVEQTEDHYTDATGDDMGDILDLDI